MAALVIEDGTLVAGANSYVTLVEAQTYASDRGYVIPVDPLEVIKHLLRAKDYLESFRSSYKGSKVSGTQSLQWPRLDVSIDNFDVLSTVIPQDLKDAQCQIVVELETADPLPSTNGYSIKRERIDVVETEYAVGYRDTTEPPLPRMPKVDRLLASLIRGGFAIRSIRI
jgi:hypothetical protein